MYFSNDQLMQLSRAWSLVKGAQPLADGWTLFYKFIYIFWSHLEKPEIHLELHPKRGLHLKLDINTEEAFRKINTNMDVAHNVVAKPLYIHKNHNCVI